MFRKLKDLEEKISSLMDEGRYRNDQYSLGHLHGLVEAYGTILGQPMAFPEVDDPDLEMVVVEDPNDGNYPIH